MQQHWINTTESHQERVQPLSEALLDQSDVLTILQDRTLIKVTGDDAEDYLQNQLTNDIRLVTENNAQLSAWCTPKGRAIVTFRIFKQADAYIISMSPDLAEKVVKRLRMFVLRSKVVMEDVTEEWAGIGLTDKESSLIGTLFPGAALSEANQAYTHDGVTVVRLPSERARFEIIGEAAQVHTIYEQLKDKLVAINSQDWRYFDVEAGQPHVTEASTEAWIPQMLNMQVIDGVSFKKGCFPGQEVVARLKYLGKNKRRIYRAEIDTQQLPEVGSLIMAEGEKSEAGKVLNASLAPSGKVEVLAVLKIAMADKLLKSNEDAVSILELPYTIPEDD